MTGEIRSVTVAVHYEADHLWAEVLELPGCFATGATPDELQQALEEAIGMYFSDSSQPRLVRAEACEELTAVKKVPMRLAFA